MANLTLAIQANFDEAIKAFKDLASESTEMGKKISEAAKSLGDKEMDKFVEKQKLVQAALTATKGPAAAMAASAKNYEREIERLIKQGLSPESEQVQRLRKEYEGLKSQTDQNAEASGSLKDKIMGMVPGIGAAVAGFKAVSGAVEAAKQFISESVAVYQESEVANARLASVLKATGAAAWTTAGQLQDMAKRQADATGKSEDDIKQMQSVLLGFRSITGEAFSGATDAIIQMSGVMGGDMVGAANAFGKALDTPVTGMASLTRYGFVFTEQDKEMVKELEASGRHLEAQKIILEAMTGSFGDAATAMNNATSSQSNYSNAVEDLKRAAGENFAKAISPVRDFFTNIIKNIGDAVQQTNDYNNALERLKNSSYTPDINGAVQKSTDEIVAYEKELEKLQETMAASIEIGVPMKKADEDRLKILPDLIESQKKYNADLVGEQEALQEAAAELARAAALKEENDKKAADAAKKAYDEMKKANEQMLANTKKYAEQLEEIRIKNDENKNDEAQLLQLQLDRAVVSIQAAKADQESKNMSIAAARELYETQIKLATEAYEVRKEKEQEAVWEAAAALQAKAMQEKIYQNEMTQGLSEYLQARMDNEVSNNEAHNAAILENYEKQKEMLVQYLAEIEATDTLTDEQKIELKKKTQDEINKINEQGKNFETKINADKLASFQTTMAGIAAVVNAFGEENRAAAIIGRAIASAEAGINTYLAATKALAEGGGVPWGLVPMAATIAAGIAQQVKINSTPLPSAETGGRFSVPGSGGPDSSLMRVNPGETVDVTPAGQSAGGTHITVMVDKQVIFDVVNAGISTGDIMLSAANF